MELSTINQIRDKRDSIRKKIKSLNLNEYSSGTFGNENEYSFKGIIAGIEVLLTDISTLTQYPSKFVKISTYDERISIKTNLTEIETYLTTPNNFITEFEALKVQIRNYNVRSISERQIEFEKEIEDVRKIKIQLQQLLVESKEIKEDLVTTQISINKKFKESNENLNEIENQLKKIIERKNEITEKAENLEEINNELESMKEIAKENLEEIAESLTESKSNEKLITVFSNKIQDREERLDILEQNTLENNKKLNEYEEERKNILHESKQLVESAKKALNYKTAEGISASFQSQYDNANNKWIIGGWLIGAIISLLLTIVLGIWILQSHNDNIGIIIGRISLLPLPIIGAIFCANQYTKQKNIIEDYAYKMVLSKAIVGFSEQLKKNSTEGNEEYVHYIKTALEEIHKDPLRKRETKKITNKNEPNLNELIEIAEKIVKMTKIE
ncbi:hypothetical protein GCM10009118_04370 [Wandonia haliotis]|uniref:Uncharacterized protein n=1 Tax=Wandonia haliotis TaxID=574963 RepID=A0ABP3Y1Q5_9FLAO